jgi:REP element-mobilizing transposase RayT
MPRQSRIDAHGALHHVIVRGIARRKIFYDDTDRDRFLERLAAIVSGCDLACFAWALIPNHFHLLIKTGSVPLSSAMRRLLTGYAVSFNKRHRRWGHLFQNRYKSILCQEETYLLELTRYIHLNPLRAGLAKNINELDRYRYAGHCAILGKCENDWQDTAYIRRRFGRRGADAKRHYRDFVCKGIEKGRRPELTGGGLIRSVGGWTALKALRKAKVYSKGDERILGDSEFVQQVLEHADEPLERKYKLRAKGYEFDSIAERVGQLLQMPVKQVMAPGKNRKTVRARSLLCYWAVREGGMTMVYLSRKLGISSTAVSQSVVRGEKIAQENALNLMPD